jgi:hypothetical protein
MNRDFPTILLFVATTALPLLCGCGAPPQLGDSKEAFAAAEALWTAITAQRGDLVEASAGQLRQLTKAGKIPAEASAALDAIVEEARAERWDSAREDLKKFVKGQRRAT